MTMRALSFIGAAIRRAWHCYEEAHHAYTLRAGGRIVEMGCTECDEVFWRVA